jgi:hypothetical protein
MPKNAMDLELELDFIKAYVLGGYGTGKSVFASTFPTPGYLFDFDQGAKTYRGRPWMYDTFPLTWKGWIEFEKVMKEVAKDVEAGKYKTVILDSTTSFTDCAMARALQIDPKRSPEGGPIWNVHFQIVKNLVEPKLREILTWPCNIVFTGHWDVKLDPKTGDIISVDPLLTGKLSEKLPGYFDEVYTAFTQQKAGKEQYIIRTTTKGYYKARSRISGVLRLLPDLLPNNYNALLKHMKEAQVKEKEFRDQQLLLKTEPAERQTQEETPITTPTNKETN